jgi:acetylornithine deacetylase/succinyl-diaminopimelate desuccinylase-like protein
MLLKLWKQCWFVVEFWLYGEKIIDKDLTVLVYGHYDVQPQTQWKDFSPFEPVIKH